MKNINTTHRTKVGQCDNAYNKQSVKWASQNKQLFIQVAGYIQVIAYLLTSASKGFFFLCYTNVLIIIIIIIIISNAVQKRKDTVRGTWNRFGEIDATSCNVPPLQKEKF